MMSVMLNTLLYVGYRNTDILLLLMFLNFNNKIIKSVMKGRKILNRSQRREPQVIVTPNSIAI